MSYRPDNQALEEPIDNLLKAVEFFQKQSQNRIESDDWSEEHIDQLVSLKKDLLDLQVRLLRLRSQTW